MEKILFLPHEIFTMLKLIEQEKNIVCPVCGEKVYLVTASKTNPHKGPQSNHPGIYCKNKCTKVLLDYEYPNDM